MPRWCFRDTLCFFPWCMYKAIISISGNILACDETGDSQQQGTCFLPQTAVSTMPGKAGNNLLSTISSPLMLLWESKSHTGLAVSFSVPVPKYMGDSPWQHLYQQATPFQFPTRINHISCKLTIRKEANETTVNITMSNILNTITVTKAERQTLNYSVQKRRKAKRDCYIIFCNSEKLNPLHL